MKGALLTCATCGKEAFTEEDLGGFATDASKKHGRRPTCNQCFTSYRTKRRQQAVGPPTLEDFHEEADAYADSRRVVFHRSVGEKVSAVELRRRLAYFAGVPLEYGTRIMRALRLVVEDAYEHREALPLTGITRSTLTPKKRLTYITRMLDDSPEVYVTHQIYKGSLDLLPSLLERVKIPDELHTALLVTARELHQKGVTSVDIDKRLWGLIDDYFQQS